MDKRLAKILIAVIGGTFILLGIIVALQVSGNREKRRFREQLYKAGELIDAGQIREATLALAELNGEDVPADGRELLNQHLQDLLFGIEGAVDAGRTSDVAFVLAKLGEEELDPELQRQVETWTTKLADELGRVRKNERQRADLRRQRDEEERRLIRQRERAADARRSQLREEKLAQFGGAFVGILYALGLFVVACILIGLGQIITAFRDVAVNSHLLVKRVVPHYRFIPFVAAIFYVLAGIEILASVVIVVILLTALST